MGWLGVRQQLTTWAGYALLAGCVCIAIALGGWLVVGEPTVWTEILGALGVVLLAVTILLRPREIGAALTGRRARRGGNAALMSVAFLLILGLVNFLGARHHYRWDVTEEKRFSLSEQSLEIIKNLKEPVHALLFFTPGQYNRQTVADLMTEYAARSSELTYEFVDPDLQRTLTMSYGVTRDGTTVFVRGDRREVTFGVQEQDLTSALLKVTRDTTKTVYFLTGHQERQPDNTEADGLSMVKEALERENYAVDQINFSSLTAAPESINVLVVAGPRRPLTADENDRLLNHVNGGGGLLVMVEPGFTDPFGGMLSLFGIELPDDLVIDPMRSFFGDIATPLVDQYTFHQITKDMSGLTTIFPSSRSIVASDPAPEDWQVETLALSSESSWAETGYRSTEVDQDPDETVGPLGLAAAVEPSAEGAGRGRVVVIGTASLVSNNLLQTIMGSIGNVDLFMNAVNWLAEEEELISIRPKLPEQRQVILTPPQARGIIYSNILFLPLLVLAAGAALWWRRR